MYNLDRIPFDIADRAELVFQKESLDINNNNLLKSIITELLGREMCRILSKKRFKRKNYSNLVNNDIYETIVNRELMKISSKVLSESFIEKSINIFKDNISKNFKVLEKN